MKYRQLREAINAYYAVENPEDSQARAYMMAAAPSIVRDLLTERDRLLALVQGSANKAAGKGRFEAWLRSQNIEPTYTLDGDYSGAMVCRLWEQWQRDQRGEAGDEAHVSAS